MTPTTPKPATAADLRAIDDNDRLEIVGGVIVEKAPPPPPDQRRPGRLVDHDRDPRRVRDRSVERPAGWPVKLRPDWVCEIVSPKHERQDLVVKPRVLHAAEVPHYWPVHPEEKMLLGIRWTADGHTVVLTATSGDRVRAEPFDALEPDASELFGDEADE